MAKFHVRFVFGSAPLRRHSFCLNASVEEKPEVAMSRQDAAKMLLSNGTYQKTLNSLATDLVNWNTAQHSRSIKEFHCQVLDYTLTWTYT